jgi:hypothetical protein
MFKLLIILGICYILLLSIHALIIDREKAKNEAKNAGKIKIMSITIKKDGHIISHEDVYK